MNAELTDPPDNPYDPLAKLGVVPPRRPMKSHVPVPDQITVPSQLAPAVSLAPARPGATFLCPNCRTTLIVPVGQLSGLCPTCSYLFAEQANIPLPLVPLTASYQAQVDASLPTTATSQSPREPDAELLSSRRSEAQWMNRSGKVTFRPLKKSDIPDRQLEFDREVPKEAASSERPITQTLANPKNPRKSTRSRFRTKLIGAAAAVLLIAAVTGIGSTWLMKDHKGKRTSPPEVSVQDLRKRLNAGALESLQAALATDDPATIAAHVVGCEAMIPAIQERLTATGPFPHFSEFDEVSAIELGDADYRNGLSGLLYQAAPRDAMRLDSPLLSADMAAGIVGLGLLEGAAVIADQSNSEPRRAMALFATRNGVQCLEWELFKQTWDRTLVAFRDGELGDGPMRFRVILSLDTPVFLNGEHVDQSVIRVQDPLHLTDTIRVPVERYYPVEVLLRPSREALEKDPAAAMMPKTATVDLMRNDDTGQVTIDRIVCWEFLGLGGVEGNTGL